MQHASDTMNGRTMTPESLDNGYDEAVCIVADAEETARRLHDVLGYGVVHRGLCDPAFLALLGIDGVQGGGWREVTVLQPQAVRGRMRIIQPSGPVPQVRRMGAQPWDVGGFFDVSVRCLGPIDDLLAAFCRNGFSAFAPVADFEMAGLCVREALAHDGDGLCFAMVQRIAPPLAGWDHIEGPASNPFNSVITVESLDAAKRFFIDGLGWQALVDTALVHADGRNVMGLPRDLARERPVRLAIVQQQGRMEGSIELIEYPCEPLDFRADEAHWRGIAALCFPVSDLAGILARAGAAGCATGAPRMVNWSGRGAVAAGWVMTQWAARLVFYEVQA